MDCAKGFMGRDIHSGGRKSGDDQQPPVIQEPGGDHGQQQQPVPSKAPNKSRSRSPLPKSRRATTTSYSRSSAQSSTVAIVDSTLPLASGRSGIAAASDELVPPGRDPALSSGSGGLLLAVSATPGDIARDVNCSPPAHEPTSGGKPEDSATAIPVLSSSDPQTSSTVPQAVGDNNCSSDTKDYPTVSPSIDALWQKALGIAQESLAKHKLPFLEITSFQSQCAAENIQSLLAELEAAHLRGSEVAWVERLGKIMKSVDKYVKIVDTTIQHHPNVTSVVWAGARTILQVALNHVEAMECFEETMVTIMDKMAVSAFYASIYEGVELQTAMGDTDKLHKVLHMALPELYAAIIVFSIKARQYFDTRWVRKAINMLKPFAIEFQSFIDDINRKEKIVQECTDMAIVKRLRGSTKNITEIKNLLNSMREYMKLLLRLNDTSDSLIENVKVPKEIFKYNLDVKDKQLLQLLSTLEPFKRHADIRSIRFENTGTWLLELECFHKWCDLQGSERILCCYAIPGAGKTLISSLVIDHLCSQVTKQTSSRTSVVCLYADYRDQKNQTLIHILGSFIHQFLTSASLLHIPDQVIKTLKDVKTQNTKVDIEDILFMLILIVEQLDNLFFCIDALDELELQTRRDLLDILSYMQFRTKTTRLFFTGRPDIQSEVRTYFEIPKEQEVEFIANENDIRQFLRHKIAEDRSVNPDVMNEVLENEILSALIARSKGMFLLPTLHIAMVMEQTTISKRRKALTTLPTELNDTFRVAIKQIEQSRGYAELGMKVLLWLHLAYRPLKLEELQHALAVEKDDVQFEVDNIPSRKTILDCCLGLVLIDEETMTVRFAHYSLEEYFRLHTSTYFPDGYSDAAETCLLYLTFPEIRDHCKSSDELDKKICGFPFLEYAACNWGTYAKLQSNETIMKLAFRLPGDGNECPSAPLQVLFASITDHWELKCQQRVALLFSGIHVGAFFGLDEFTKCYCEMGQADLHDDSGRSPLSWAAGRGHEAVVRLLLERNDVDVNAKDNHGRSPLSWAAENGHGAAVRLLLERIDVDTNAKDDECGQTPLSWAAENGHEAVVRLLLERNDVDVDAKDNSDRSPLSWAAENGHEAIVPLLLERNDVDVDAKDNNGWSPLSWAAGGGHEAVVQLLLERNDVDVCAKDNDGRSPLSWAAKNEHEAVVQLLLERNDVNVDAKDNSGRSPLSWAAENGNEEVVQLLLERDDVDVDAKDNNGWSPLSLAAGSGNEDVVRLLLERNDVDADAKDNNGRSPLSWAAGVGHEAVVRLLLERNDVNVDAKDKDGRSPLSWAAGRGHEAVVRLLIEQNNTNLDVKDNQGQAALDWATLNGHISITKLLQAAAVHKQLDT